MEVRESIAGTIADEEKVHQLSVIGNQRQFIVLLEKCFSNFEPQNSLRAVEPDVRGQIGPRAREEVAAKRFFFDLPPVFSAGEGGDEDDGGGSCGKIAI